MSSKDIYEKFEESKKDNTLVCTKKDLEEFLMYGIVLKTGNKYLTRNNQTLKLDLLKVTELKFNLNLSDIICKCTKLSKQHNSKKVYCMTKDSYKEYKDKGLIVQMGGQDYYRLFNKELWLVYLV